MGIITPNQYTSFNGGGSVVTNPQAGLNTNQNKYTGLFNQPKQSNILAGYSLGTGQVKTPDSGIGTSTPISGAPATQNPAIVIDDEVHAKVKPEEVKNMILSKTGAQA